MKTNELNNGIKGEYVKPTLEIEEMEVQWNYLTCDCPEDETTGDSGGEVGTGSADDDNFDDC